MAGQAGAEPAVQRAGFAFKALAEPGEEEVDRYRAGRVGLSPEQAMGHALTDLYIRLHARAALNGMMATIEEWRPDVVVRESAEFSSLIAAERLGIRHALVGIGLSTQLESRMLSLAGPALDELGATVGVEPGLGARSGRSLCLTMAPPSLDDSSSGSERVRRFRGVDGVSAGSPPNGWGDPSAPLVYVSFGTEVPSPTRDYFPDLYLAALQALQEVGARVLVTIGDERDPGELGPLAPSVRVERWVSQAELMPHTAAMVGHAGSGSTLTALAAGVPMALVPLFADQPFNAHRVAGLGAAIALDGGAPSLPALGQAVSELLSDTRYRDRASAIAQEIQTLAPVDEAPNVLSALVERQLPSA
jgi:hypothetical protein